MIKVQKNLMEEARFRAGLFRCERIEILRDGPLKRAGPPQDEDVNNTSC